MPNRLIRDVIARGKPITASANSSVSAAARMMKKHHDGAVMVVDDGRLTGIFTERDAVFRVLAEGRDTATTHLSEVMTAAPRTIDADKAVGHALMMMYDGGFRHVPVVDHGKPIGMISARDALGPELKEFETDLVQREHIGEVL